MGVFYIQAYLVWFVAGWAELYVVLHEYSKTVDGIVLIEVVKGGNVLGDTVVERNGDSDAVDGSKHHKEPYIEPHDGQALREFTQWIW